MRKKWRAFYFGKHCSAWLISPFSHVQIFFWTVLPGLCLCFVLFSLLGLKWSITYAVYTNSLLLDFYLVKVFWVAFLCLFIKIVSISAQKFFNFPLLHCLPSVSWTLMVYIVFLVPWTYDPHTHLLWVWLTRPLVSWE